MRSILTLIITLVLISTFGCNYEYGNYGKSKSDEKNTEAPEPTNQAIVNRNKKTHRPERAVGFTGEDRVEKGDPPTAVRGPRTGQKGGLMRSLQLIYRFVTPSGIQATLISL